MNSLLALFIPPDHAAHEFDPNQPTVSNSNRLLTDKVEQFRIYALARAAYLAGHPAAQRLDRYIPVDFSQLCRLEEPFDVAVPATNERDLPRIVGMHKGPWRAFVPSFGLVGHTAERGTYSSLVKGGVATLYQFRSLC
ncbi:hypothetical protein [Mesorhizobium sp. ES1-3]|uniref:hypothetical protein n=1 Tax=Mesorhizobium sp. ES1-3 TaxID=2876628 RepID=UPI001CCAFE81|nr:hypothetical protein [Mesorhizobium sp. ES1-3]MBZ9671652.1 hypothetical protein [Mesorhizobium sp. ES1-3]